MIEFYGKQGSVAEVSLGEVKKWTQVGFWRYIYLVLGGFEHKVEFTKKEPISRQGRLDYWTCHICGESRPDHFIDVYSRPIMIADSIGQENIRHCNDKQDCIDKAKTFSHLSSREKNLNEE